MSVHRSADTTSATGPQTVWKCDATNGALIVDVSAAASCYDLQPRWFVKIDSSVNSVTIDANGSETINGSLTYVLSNQWDAVGIVSDGSNWFVVAKK